MTDDQEARPGWGRLDPDPAPPEPTPPPDNDNGGGDVGGGQLLEAPAYAYEDSPALRLWVGFHHPDSGPCGGPETVEVSWTVQPSLDELLTVFRAITDDSHPA